MELDKRIDSIDDIFTPFSGVKLPREFIGAEGYFANNIETFSDLSTCRHGTLKCVVELEDIPCKYGMKENGVVYKYFLPNVCVNDEEPKFRPFTLDEFLKRFPPLSPVTIKFKDSDDYINTVYFIGYEHTEGTVNLGGVVYRLDELFNDYELRDKDGNWVVFGVEE